ncbi:hypothetical protein YB2330_004676 [Saitoella coloradoensis]
MAIANPNYIALPVSKTGYKSLNDFYPYYLGEHGKKTTRRLHMLGTTLGLFTLLRLLLAWSRVAGWEMPSNQVWKLAVGGLIQGYFWAWIGHFFVEKNRPATFKYPFYSFACDWKMWWEVITLERDF